MKTNNHFKNLAIAIIVLGTIHLAATPMVLPMYNTLNINNLLSFIYMFIATGLAMIFVGWLQFYLLKNGIRTRHEYQILKISVVFIAILGIGSVATMWNNPFAYISLLLALCETIIISKTRLTIETTA